MPYINGRSREEGEVARELHRLRESEMLLLLKAEALGLTAPKSCCTHAGPTACRACTLDWLVAYAGLAKRELLCSGRSAHHA